ncbi:MAG: hydrolase [Acidobacteriota bacterium]|nr:hydrolase [Acidobacteriota bacterium]
MCATCGVEHAEATGTCVICADERQWIPAAGQVWTSLRELRDTGHRVVIEELEPGLQGLRVEPSVGIGQQAHLVVTPRGSVLWDVPPFIDRPAVDRIRAHAPVLAIVASHPHMFGVQSAWSHALEQAPILVCEPLLDWVQRPDAAISSWRGRHELAPGLVLYELGGHFTGSSVLHWAAGAAGRGVLLSSDTIHGNPDGASVTFMRSYPNRIPLSGAVVERLAAGVAALPFDRLYDNFGRGPRRDAAAAVQRSAERYSAWVRGDFDDLTWA